MSRNHSTKTPLSFKKRMMRLAVSVGRIYLLTCAVLYWQQGRFIFIPSRTIEETPADYQLAYENVELSVLQPIFLEIAGKRFTVGGFQPRSPMLRPFCTFTEMGSILGPIRDKPVGSIDWGFQCFCLIIAAMAKAKAIFLLKRRFIEMLNGLGSISLKNGRFPPRILCFTGTPWEVRSQST